MTIVYKVHREQESKATMALTAAINNTDTDDTVDF